MSGDHVGLHDGAGAATSACPPIAGDARSRAIVELPVSVEEVKAAFQGFDAVSAAILSDVDFQEVTGAGGTKRRIRAKSAWYRLAIAYNVTERVDLEHLQIEKEPGTGRWVSVYARVVMQAPNGRLAVGHHACHVTEKCCPASMGEACYLARFADHTCCPNGCTGRWHWNLPGDMVATAHTRAKARAISDLIGSGVAGDEERDVARAPAAPEPASPPDEGLADEGLYEKGKAMTAAQEGRLMPLARKLKFDCEFEGRPALALARVSGLRLPPGAVVIERRRLTRRQASLLITHYVELARSGAGGKAGKA